MYATNWQARKKIENVLECVIEEKRRALEKKETREVHSQMDKLIMARDENGMKLYDNNAIIDLLLGLLHGGHHTPAYAAMWALVHISENPHIFYQAKVSSFFQKPLLVPFVIVLSYVLQEEQESILKQRPSTQKGLTFQEIKQMKYLMKVCHFFFINFLRNQASKNKTC